MCIKYRAEQLIGIVNPFSLLSCSISCKHAVLIPCRERHFLRLKESMPINIQLLTYLLMQIDVASCFRSPTRSKDRDLILPDCGIIAVGAALAHIQVYL